MTNKTRLGTGQYIAALTVMLVSAAWAAPGSLDTTFQLTGKETTPFPGGGADIGQCVVVQPADGKIILAGRSRNGSFYDFALARYGPNGAQDNSFGVSGKVTTNLAGDTANARSVVVQPNDGKIIAAGYAYIPNVGLDFAMVRYLPTGAIDTAFGSPQNGKVITSFGTFHDGAEGVALQSDGKIILGGWAQQIGGLDRFALARYTDAGTLDPTFGNNGKVYTDFPSGGLGLCVAVQSDQKILIGGLAGGSNGDDLALARYDQAGNLDGTFGTGGKVTTSLGSGSDSATSIALLPDGKILLGGSSLQGGVYKFALVRYHPNGDVDSTFGSGGRVFTDFGVAHSYGQSLAVQTNGRIVLGGYTTSFSDTSHFSLARYLPGGALDSTFGAGGKATLSFGASDEKAYSVAVQPDQKILIGGYTSAGTTDFAIARYDGSSSNSSPQTQADKTVTVQEDDPATPLAIASPTDSDQDPLTVTVTNVPTSSRGVVRRAGGGALITAASTLSITELTGLEFLPAPDANGAAGYFEYTVSDGQGGSASQRVTLEITPVNDPPVAQANSSSGWRGCPLRVPAPGVLGNDTDVDANPLTASVQQQPTGGTLVLNANGSFTYTPNPGTTSDSFTYRAFDGTDYSTPATVTLTLAADTVPPTGSVGAVVTESASRVYVPLSVADGQSGVARVLLTANSTNCRLEWDGPSGLVTAPIGTPLLTDPAVASTSVRVVKLNASQRARVEVQITDCAGNSTLVDPVLENLQVEKRQLTRVYRRLTAAEHRLKLENGTPGLASLKVWVNGQAAHSGALPAGEVLRLDLARWLRPGDRNTVKVTVTGPAGGTAVLLIGDDSLAGAAAATRRNAGAVRAQLELPQ